MSSKFIDNFLNYPPDRQTDRHTEKRNLIDRGIHLERFTVKSATLIWATGKNGNHHSKSYKLTVPYCNYYYYCRGGQLVTRSTGPDPDVCLITDTLQCIEFFNLFFLNIFYTLTLTATVHNTHKPCTAQTKRCSIVWQLSALYSITEKRVNMGMRLLPV